MAMIFGGNKGTWMKLGKDWVNIDDDKALRDSIKSSEMALNAFLVIFGVVIALFNCLPKGDSIGIIIGIGMIVIGLLCLWSRIIHKIFWWTVFLGVIGGVIFVGWYIYSSGN